MEQLLEYIKPELIIVAVVLYFLGSALKKASLVKDKYIPFLLGGVGIVICSVYIFAVCDCRSGQDAAMAIFTAVTQGILVAGLSTYANQIMKQLQKKE
ncbi:MAG: phage holin family protein [Ruminococcus sp.]